MTAAAAGSVALLAATAALAIATHPDGTKGVVDALQALTPPPGAAILFIAALLAARRGNR